MMFRLLPLFLLVLGPSAGAHQVPPTPKKTALHEYHGQKVKDDYEWLENSSDAKVQAWTQAQADFTNRYLSGIPERAGLAQKLKEWNDFQTATYKEFHSAGGVHFALKLVPPKSQPVLASYTNLNDLKTERIVLDPTVIDSKGTTAIDFYQPSLDGKLVAVSLSVGGSEIGTLHIFATSDGHELGDQVADVTKPTGGGSVAWNKDGSGFYYTRYPKKGERPDADLDFYQQVYFHKIGDTTDKDIYCLGKEFPRIAEVALSTSHDGQYVLATVADGDGGEFAHYILGTDTKWRQLTEFKDKVTHARFGLHKDLYLISLLGSPKGKLLRMNLEGETIAGAKVVVPEGAGVVADFMPTDSKIYLSYLAGGPTEIHAYTLKGEHLLSIPLPALSSSLGLVSLNHENDIAFRTQSYLRPSAIFTYGEANAEKKSAPSPTELTAQTPVSFEDIEVRRDFATSKDGTKVPLTLLYKKGLKNNKQNRTILYGYGGYGISLSPSFNPDLHLWLERGGVYAIANLRGGGEFGEEWHLAGNLTKKQNVFDDFIACAEHLIATQVTSAKYLAIEGRSNGGLLMGAALTQRPDLFRAVVSHVGIYDMLRVENDSNGAFNITEFGTVKDPEQFKALYAYSPLHHVSDKKTYPAALITTGANDGRVSPYHSKKMVARLQAVNKSKRPVLLRVTFDGGHGMGRSVTQKVNEEADVLAFLFSELK